MVTPVYEKGTIKVIWIENKANETHSKMFEEVKKAEQFAKGLSKVRKTTLFLSYSIKKI